MSHKISKMKVNITFLQGNNMHDEGFLSALTSQPLKRIL